MNRPLLLLALICAASMTSCATSAPPSAPLPPNPPRREMPATAREVCTIPPPPAEVSIPALNDYAKALLGVIVKCDIGRQLAVDVHDGEHADEDAWRRNASPGVGSIVGG